MNRSHGNRMVAAAAVLLGLAFGPTAPVAAALFLPVAAPATATAGAEAIQVRGRRGDAGAAVAAGVAGLIIGGIMAGQQRDYYDGPYYYRRGYYAPAPFYVAPVAPGPGWESYCFSRYRSFDPVTGTYLGHDGRRHYCQ